MWGPYFLKFLFAFAERDIFGANLPLVGFAFAISGFALAQVL